MVVKTPRRPRDTDAGRDRRQSKALREQALIEEARQRARRRRRRNLAVVMLALTSGAALGLGPTVGVQVGERLADEPSPVLGGAAKVRNGQIAVADGSGTLQVVKPDGTGLHVRAACRSGVAGCGIFQPAWSPDGTRLAFVRGHAQQYPADWPAMDVYVTSRDGGTTKLAACGSCAAENVFFGSRLDWSPDGTEIVFSSDTGIHRRLWIVDSRGGQLRQLTRCGSDPCSDKYPDWSPNGELIVFSRVSTHNGGRSESLYTVRADGTGLTRLDKPRAAVAGGRVPSGPRT